MNKDVRVVVRQSLFDIAVQQCGSVEAVFAIAERNNLSITDALDPGMLIEITDGDVVDKTVSGYYKQKGIRPATDAPPNGSGGSIDDLLDDGIDFMAIQVDNVVT